MWSNSNSKREAGRQKEEAREEFSSNANKIKGGSHTLEVLSQGQNANPQLLYGWNKVQGLSPDLIGIMKIRSLNTPILGLINNKHSKGKENAF